MSVYITDLKIYVSISTAASNKIGLEADVDNTKYMVMSRYQNATRSHNIKIDNISFENVKQFRYLGPTLT
jgi:hypothetical protein